MSATKDAQKAVINAKIPSSVREATEALAKGMGVAAIELWGVFVRESIVKGIGELFVGAVIIWVALQFEPLVHLWWLLGVIAATPLFYGAIQLIGNPKYRAVAEITDKIIELK